MWEPLPRLLLFNFRAISSGLIGEYLAKANDETYAFLHFFTVNSAILSSLGAAFMVPYAVEGIRKKRFAFPKWVSLFQFSGAFCTSLTMFFAFTFIYLTQGAKVAFGGPNFWMHVVCPIFSLVLFLSVEIDRTLSVRDSLICMTPFFIYSVFYVFNAVLIGEELGGWRDFYMFATYTPATYSLPMIYVFAFIVITIIRLIYNSLSAHRTSLFISSMGADISEIEINIEIYGLGRYNGKHLDFSDMTIPYDIFRMLEKQYGVSIEKLSVIYSKGINDGIKERKERKSRVLSLISSLIGKPEKD